LKFIYNIDKELIDFFVKNLNEITTFYTYTRFGYLIDNKSLHIFEWLESKGYRIEKSKIWNYALLFRQDKIIKWINESNKTNNIGINFWNKESLKMAILSKNFKLIKLAHKTKLCPKDLLSAEIINTAIRTNQLHLVEWFIDRGYKCDENSYSMMLNIENGNYSLFSLEILPIKSDYAIRKGISPRKKLSAIIFENYQ
jgi:hypothetical protein